MIPFVSPVKIAAVLMLWLAVVLTGTGLLIQYSQTPGRAGLPPATWPVESHVPHDALRPTLVMFIHPQCPCSRASIGELEQLVARCQGQLSAQVLFFSPLGMNEDWIKSALWRQAKAIPDVKVYRDDAGVEAGLFQAETSGQTLLYNRDGNLMFQGGITISRGHSGDNPGRSALAALLEGRRSDPVKALVFGCALMDSARLPGGIP